ncbi:MAG: CpXC domain-containing protein [Anaerolineae bacterium]|nr:CpXC domain-containing protein [Anaerolineae bacterium]MDW8171460.1 CpXC domain-containing protein [Anaerolineae bacterium]
MSQPNPVSLRCSSCGQAFPAPVRTIVDAQNDPQGKSLLLAENLNRFRCPHCGHLNQVVAPLLYHDASKELFIAYIPMEVSMQTRQPEEKIVGDLLNEFTRSLPQGAFRAYMFNPKRALTLQGLIDQVLQADGISREALDEQKRRVELIQKLVEARDAQSLIKTIQDNDAPIDLAFFQTLVMMAQRLAEQGQQETAARLASLQEALLAFSSYGQQLEQQQQAQEGVIREVGQAIQALGNSIRLDDLVSLALSYANEEAKLQALVGLLRPALDQNFFAEMTRRISQAAASEREAMEVVRDRILHYVQTIDQQQQRSMQRMVEFLQMVVNSPEPEALLEANAEMVSSEVMAVLQANLQEAERRGDQRALQLLSRVYNKCLEILQAQMSPELRFINELLNAPDPQTMQALADEHKAKFQPQALAETLTMVREVLEDRGQPAALSRLDMIEKALMSS